jgi:ATP-dependent RNA helicase DDX10/DBP4
MDLYRKVVEQSIGAMGGNDSDEDFMTVKRVDHELPALMDSIIEGSKAADLSKRKIKMGKSKKAMAKLRGLGEKLIFDDEGNAHQVYELKKGDEEPKQDVMKLGKEFAEEQRGVMKDIDVVDKEVARTKRKEKKRKQRDRERVSYTVHNPRYDLY